MFIGTSAIVVEVQNYQFGYNYSWLVVDLPLWKILVNGKDDIPYIMENTKCLKPPTR